MANVMRGGIRRAVDNLAVPGGGGIRWGLERKSERRTPMLPTIVLAVHAIAFALALFAYFYC
jgi:hypothetical protein